MNILYYVPEISKTWGGVYQYALSLLKSLAEDANYKNQFYVYLLNEDPSYLELADKYGNIHVVLEKDKPSEKEPFLAEAKEPYRIAKPSLMKITKGSSRLKKFVAVRYNYRKIHRYKQSGYQEMTYLNWVIRKNQIEIIHCPFQSVYTVDDIPAITTMHDVQELHFPQFFTSAQRAWRAVHYKQAIETASAVVVSYQHIKEDIIRFFAKPAEQVYVCLLDMQDLWFDRLSENDIVDLNEYNLPEKFILYPAATWAHKNHIRLLEAISYLKKERQFEVNLVCTGHQSEYYDFLKEAIKQLNIERNVTFLGVVADQVLLSLYRRTSAVVVPTLYEAGSFPLMESILLNVPVICSNVTSLPETIGNRDFIFDYDSHTQIAEKIHKILTDEDFKIKNIENSLKQAPVLRENQISKRINNLYNKLIRKHDIGQKELA